MNSFLPSCLSSLFFLSPSLVLNTPKPPVKMNCLSMFNSGYRFCLLLIRSGFDLSSIEISWSKTLIWNNLPYSDQSARPDTFSKREWINKNVHYANHTLSFTLLNFPILLHFWVSARQQAYSLLLHQWISLSSVCALLKLQMSGAFFDKSKKGKEGKNKRKNSLYTVFAAYIWIRTHFTCFFFLLLILLCSLRCTVQLS